MTDRCDIKATGSSKIFILGIWGLREVLTTFYPFLAQGHPVIKLFLILILDLTCSVKNQPYALGSTYLMSDTLVRVSCDTFLPQSIDISLILIIYFCLLMDEAASYSVYYWHGVLQETMVKISEKKSSGRITIPYTCHTNWTIGSKCLYGKLFHLAK